MRGRIVTATIALAAVAGTAAPAARAFDPAYEAKNYSKINERYAYESGTAAYQTQLATVGLASEAELIAIRANDPERDSSTNLCQHHMNGCAGDVRFYDWQAQGHGMRIPVLYTARDGAVISGHLWATREGPAVRPGVVITTGSVQAPEELYSYAAATLAKKGYVVLTYDVETQGRSDSHGAGGDSGYYTPQTPGPFIDGTEDALDFFYSTPAHPYEPRYPADPGDKPLAEDHRPKQDRRVKAGLANAYNPLSSLVDPGHVGLVGHSLGAAAVSQVAAEDARVKAVVALDNLSAGGGSMFGQTTPPITARVPALGMSADYGLTPMPNTSDPDPLAKSDASKKASALGVDTGELIIRGGTHYEFSYIPTATFGATLRGMDMVAWYAGAWMDRYLKQDPTADARLLTTRWLDDPPERAIDPVPDGNLFSTYYRSRIDIGHQGGRRVTCEDLRAGTAGCSALAPDGLPGSYSYLGEAFTPDRATGPAPGSGLTAAEAARFRQAVGLSSPRLASDAGTTARFAVRVRAAAHADLVDHYELQLARRAAAPYRAVTFGLGVPRLSYAGADGHTYRFRARAIGRGGILGPWSGRTTVVPVDDRRDRGHPRFGAGWRRARDPRAYRSGLTGASRAGARMTFSFRGRRVYLIGRKGPAGGRAIVRLDGHRQVVDFYARRTRERTVIFSRYVRARRRHTLAVVTTGRHHPRSHGTRVDVDAVGVLQ